MANPTGFYYTYSFTNGNCAFLDNNPYEIYAFATDVCLKSSASTSAILSYYASAITGPSILRTLYSSPDCNPALGSTNSTLPLTCQNIDQQTSYYHGYVAGTDIHSVVSQDYPYATVTYYGEDKCSTLLAFTSVINDVCVADSSSTSIYANYPTKYTYSKSANCTGPDTTTTYLSGCTDTGSTTSSFTYISSTLINGDSSSSSNSNDGLSTGAVVGIIVGSVVGGLVLVAILYYVFARKMSAQKEPLLNSSA